MADAIMITDRDGNIEYVNAAFEDATGFSEHEAVGETPRLLKSGLHTQAFYRRMWKTLLDGQPFRDVLINRRKSGELYYEEKSVTPLRAADGTISRFISVGRDVTARIRTQQRLEHLAYRDVLTGLPNRALFMDRLRQAIAGARRRHSMVAVLFIDLDGFKSLNDHHGHEVGDRFLRALAARLLRNIRGTDTVARLGGDEFAVLLDDAAKIEDVINAGAKILDATLSSGAVPDLDAPITASIGASVFPGDGDDASALLRHADEAMYRAKQFGKNRIEFYAASHSASVDAAAPQVMWDMPRAQSGRRIVTR